MALDLLKRIEHSKGLFAVEKISLIYNALTSIIILFIYPVMEHPGQMLWERALIVALTFALIRLYRMTPCRLSAFIRMAVQMSLLSYWYPDTYEFNRLLPNLDHVFATAEQTIFGSQPAMDFYQALPNFWLSEAFNLGYFSYYPMIFVVCVWYCLFRFELFEKVSFVLVTSFFLYYLFYIVVPVAGPQFYFPAIGLENVSAGVFPAIGDYFNEHVELLPAPGEMHGFFYNLVETSQQVGERPTAAFPSSHVGISTILMIMAFRGNRVLFVCLLPFYLLLCCATVYIQAHYLIDAIAGFVSAFFVYSLATHLYKKWFVSPMFRTTTA